MRLGPGAGAAATRRRRSGCRGASTTPYTSERNAQLRESGVAGFDSRSNSRAAYAFRPGTGSRPFCVSVSRGSNASFAPHEIQSE
jgi:hypothetical protein